MSEIPLTISRQIDNYEPVHIEGLTLYPIQVKDYYDFLIARQVLGFLPQTLPIELMSKPLLEAFYLIDIGAVETDAPRGMFTASLLLLALALRLLPNGTAEERVRRFNVVADVNDPTKLKALRFIVNGEEQVDITPVMFSRILPIISAQNGVESVDTDANPELVEAEQDLISAKAPKLDFSIEALKTAVSVLSQKDKKELDEWAILKLNHHSETYKRILDFLICGIGESQGTTWKGGNPVPHPFFAKLKEGSNALLGMDSFLNGTANSAVQNADANTKPPDVFK